MLSALPLVARYVLLLHLMIMLKTFSSVIIAEAIVMAPVTAIEVTYMVAVETTEVTGTRAIIDVIAMMTGIVIRPVASDPAHLDVVVTNAVAAEMRKGKWKSTIGGTMIVPDMKTVVLMIAVPAVTMKEALAKEGTNLGMKRRTVVGGKWRADSTQTYRLLPSFCVLSRSCQIF